MDLPNLKDLQQLFKLCRKQGVSKITLAEMIVEFGEMPTVIKGGERVAAEDEEALPVAPSDEDMLYWSSQPDPLAARVEADQ